jgi:hypothetical protein
LNQKNLKLQFHRFELWFLRRISGLLMDNLHVRLNFNLSKEKGIKHNSQKKHNKISKIAKFGGEML